MYSWSYILLQLYTLYTVKVTVTYNYKPYFIPFYRAVPGNVWKVVKYRYSHDLFTGSKNNTVHITGKATVADSYKLCSIQLQLHFYILVLQL